MHAVLGSLLTKHVIIYLSILPEKLENFKLMIDL